MNSFSWPEVQQYKQQEKFRGGRSQDKVLHRQDMGNAFEFGGVLVYSRPGRRVTQHQCIQRIYDGQEKYKAVKHIMGSSWHHINQKNGAQRFCNAKGKL